MKLPFTQSVSTLEAMYREIKYLELGVLLSGLTILVKDMAAYQTTHGINSEMAEGFRLAYLDMLNDNRDYWGHFGSDLYLPLKDACLHGLIGLPEGFASDAAHDKTKIGLLTKIELLTDPRLEVEWLRAPGWHFLKAYSRQRKNDILSKPCLKTDSSVASSSQRANAIPRHDITLKELRDAFCEGKNPYQCEEEDVCEETNPYKPIEGLVGRLIGTEKQFNKFWHPVMLYMAYLLQKTNFTTLE